MVTYLVNNNNNTEIGLNCIYFHLFLSLAYLSFFLFYPFSLDLSFSLIPTFLGVPGLVKPGMLKPGVVLVDVGLNRLRTSDNKDIVVGDMDKDVKQVPEGHKSEG